MKSPNELNMSTHEELCAYVLGELGAPERARIERALEASPELRAQRERIAATIGLVQAACTGSQSLPAEFLGDIERFTAPRRAWYAQSWLRAAAVFAVLAGGIIALQESIRDRERRAPGEELARAESGANESARELDELRDSKKSNQGGATLRGEPGPGSDGGKLGSVAVVDSIDIEVLENYFDGGFIDCSALALEGSSGSTGAPSPEFAQAPNRSPAEQRQEAFVGAVVGETQPRLDAPHASSAGEFSANGPMNDLAPGDPYSASGRRAGEAGDRGVAGRTASPHVSGATSVYKGRDAASRQRMLDALGYIDSPAISPGGENEIRESSPPLPRIQQGGEQARRALGSQAERDGAGGPSSPGPPPDPNTPAGNDLFLGAGVPRHDDDRAALRRQLTPAELDLLVEQRVERVLADCRRRPHERPAAMYFRFWGDNPFVLTQLDPQSTFGVDVDTASYALARRYLSEGFLPEKAQIRTEEFVNYFAPDVAAPLEDTFAVHTELAPNRLGAAFDGGQRWMLRVVVRGKEVSREERQPLALTFVIDTSGSMQRENRLELVKHSLRLLGGELDARDSIALVAFSNEARVILPMTSAAQRGLIEAALFGLNAQGGTNAEAGLKLGYELSLASLSPAARSRVVLLSDGVANIGQTDQDRLGEDVRRHREAGIYLNTIGVGFGNHNDQFLEQLANKGDGICNYVDGPLEARRALVDNFIGAFEPIARDVKVQVEFDPERVHRYRLLGYENRAIADRDFRNDAIDAGEVGAGHQVTALYELELAAPPTGDDAKLATVRLRWKAPTGAERDPLEDAATEREFAVAGVATSWEASSAGYKRAVLVARFAEVLRRSTHARDISLDELLAEASQLERQLADPDFREFVALVEKSRRLVLAARPRQHDPLERCVDTLRRNSILHAELEELRFARDSKALEELELQNRELEARIRQLMREKIAAEGQ